MANGNNVPTNGNNTRFTVISVSTGALAIVAGLVLNVSKDAQVALSVVEQHGAEFNQVRGQIALIRDDIRERTRSRYTKEDAQRDLKYIEKRLDQIEAKCLTDGG